MTEPYSRRPRASLPTLAAAAFVVLTVVTVPALFSGTIQGDALTVLTVCVPAVSVLVVRLVEGRFLAPAPVFLILASVFAFGQFWRDLLGLPVPTAGGYTEVSDIFSPVWVQRAATLALVVVMAVASGYLMACLVPRASAVRASAPSALGGRGVWLGAGLALVGPAVMGDLQRAANVAALGYGDGYRLESPALYTVNAVFPIFVLGVLLTWRGNRVVAGAALAVALLRDLFVVTAVQNRGQSVAEAIVYVMIWSRHYGIGRLGRVVGAAAIVGTVVILPFVSFTRSGAGEQDLAEFLIQNNPLSIFLTEFGGTLASAAYAAQYVDGGGSTLGARYFVSLIGEALPIVGTSITEAAGTPLTGEAMNSFFRRTGLGGSFVADMFLNFGNIAIVLVAAVLMGVLLNMLGRSIERPVEGRTFAALWSWYLFLGTVITVRGYLTDLATAAKVGGIVLLAMMVVTQVLGAGRRPLASLPPGARGTVVPRERASPGRHALTNTKRETNL